MHLAVGLVVASVKLAASSKFWVRLDDCYLGHM